MATPHMHDVTPIKSGMYGLNHARTIIAQCRFKIKLQYNTIYLKVKQRFTQIKLVNATDNT